MYRREVLDRVIPVVRAADPATASTRAISARSIPS